MNLEQLKPGDLIPESIRPPITRTQLALFAGASGDHNPIHLDDEEARRGGLPGVIGHGMLSMAFLAQLLTDLVPNWQIRTFQARFVGMTKPGDVIACSGEVTGRSTSKGQIILDLAVRAKTQDEAIVLDGTARIAVPTTRGELGK